MYGVDLARTHEAGFSWLAEAAAREVTQHRRTGRVLDVGCGGGTLAAELAAAGFHVQGFDISPDMVALAQTNVPEGHFWVADALTAEIPASDVVTAVGEILCYAAAHGDIRPLVGRIRAALPPDGFFLCDVATPERGEQPPSTLHGDGWQVDVTTETTGRRLRRTMSITVDGAAGPRHLSEVHEQYLFTAGEMEAMLRDAGFDIEALGSYDDVMLEQGWESFLARPSAD